MNKPIVSFESIPIDRTIIPQGELNIENKKRSNLFAWNGQFSPQFVEVLLNNFAIKNDVIIDPFVGSGTTLCESARQGLKAYGTELNASAYYMAKTYELANRTSRERTHLVHLIDEIVLNIDSSKDIVTSITTIIRCNNGNDLSNVLSTLVVLMDLYNNELSIQLLKNKWAKLKEIILNIPYSDSTIKVDMGDARKMSYKEDSATLLITSPPYINVFNYHQKYRRSVEALGYNVLSIARGEFGSNRKNRSNRILTIIQYCIDMALSLKDAIRVCKNDSRMIYVIGRESSVLGYSFCNSRLIFEIATQIFDLPFLLRQERAFKNRYGQMIYEDILHFQNNKTKMCSNEIIITKARNIAVCILNETAELNPNSDNLNFIYEAINRAETINESEG